MQVEADQVLTIKMLGPRETMFHWQISFFNFQVLMAKICQILAQHFVLHGVARADRGYRGYRGYRGL